MGLMTILLCGKKPQKYHSLINSVTVRLEKASIECAVDKKCNFMVFVCCAGVLRKAETPEDRRDKGTPYGEPRPSEQHDQREPC